VGGPDHFAWFLIDVIERLDAAALPALGKPGKGRPGYDPVMLRNSMGMVTPRSR
jgi:hypothetical protein